MAECLPHAAAGLCICRFVGLSARRPPSPSWPSLPGALLAFQFCIRSCAAADPLKRVEVHKGSLPPSTDSGLPSAQFRAPDELHSGRGEHAQGTKSLRKSHQIVARNTSKIKTDIVLPSKTKTKKKVHGPYPKILGFSSLTLAYPT